MSELVWVLRSGITNDYGSYVVGVFSSQEKAVNRIKEIKNKYTEEDKQDCGELKELQENFFQNECEFFHVEEFLVDEVITTKSLDA